MTHSTEHRWQFFRSAGLDQVALTRSDDLRHLGELDPKLWAVLSCPAQGLEIDAQTLALMDANADGQIGVQEIRAAVTFVCERLVEPAAILAGGPLALAQIDTASAPGAALQDAARQVLRVVGRPSDELISVADVADLSRLFPPEDPNGDGVVPLALAAKAGVGDLVQALLDHGLGEPDRSGQPGVTESALDRFLAFAQAHAQWQAEVGDVVLSVWGEADPQPAWAAWSAVEAKVSDHFARQRLASFDPQSRAGLFPTAQSEVQLGAPSAAASSAWLEGLPLTVVDGRDTLAQGSGLNPAWRTRIDALFERVVGPLLGARQELHEADWLALQARIAPYAQWQQRQPTDLSGPVSALALATHAESVANLRQLITTDAQAQNSLATFQELQRLVRYQRDLGTLLRNVVNLADFYGQQTPAIFQAGRLYIDRRSCDLVLKVKDPAAHARMAPLSGCYLIYAHCERAGQAPQSIVAALTAGSVDDLMVPGRHGVFVDREGQEWAARVTQVVEQPISLRQAFFAPYRRVAALVEGQFRQFAANKDKEADALQQAALKTAAQPAPAKPAPTPPAAFDIARFAGIFAAMGLAFGAIGTAITAVITGLFGLAWWQQPLAVAGALLVISGPSMALAWLKLRRRNLGPLLDANGWAVNARAFINLPFGASLTAVASVPVSAQLPRVDPFAEGRTTVWPWVVLAVVVLGTLWWWVR